METTWREILGKVERGEMTPEEGAERLAAQTRPFETDGSAAAGGVSTANPTPEAFESEKGEVVEDFHDVLSFWKRWWTIPLWVGVGVCVLSGLWMSSAAANEDMFWFFCAIFPALLGALIVALSIWSRKSRWVHVRIRESKDGRKKNIKISLPVPTELVSWGMQTFGGQIPGLREQPEVIKMVPELLKALEESGEPVVVEVNDKDGDEVRVYIT
jgi:hypothetical protein